MPVGIRTLIPLLLFITVVATPGEAQSAAGAAPPAGGDISNVVESAAGLVSPSVVEIFATSVAPGDAIVPRNADLVSTQRASGSGVIVDPGGYILTNAHVVRGAQRVRVEIPAGRAGRSILAGPSRPYNARIVGMDLETDLALLQVEANDLPALTFADSEELRAGQFVLAFGSPLGLSQSVSLGVVSTVARQLEPDSPMVYVQTDASINPGSSGGPLVDLRGRVVGINTLIVSQAGGHDGLGFAVPSNIARTVYEQLRKTGRVRRGDIGVRGQTVTPVLAAGLGLQRQFGVVLADVIPGSPAARAGLRSGDLLTAVDGKAMENARQLQVNLYRRLVGEVVHVDVIRDGKPYSVPVAVGERHDPMGSLAAAADLRQNLVERLGILGIALDTRIAELIPVVRVPSGVVVASTMPGALDTREGGLAPGDVIYAINRQPVRDPAELRSVIESLRSGDPVVLQLERRGELIYLAFSID